MALTKIVGKLAVKAVEAVTNPLAAKAVAYETFTP
jgi:hypothetical protein